MSSESENKTTGESMMPKGVSEWEKAWHWKWVIRLAHFALFADIVLIATNHPMLLQWSTSTSALLENAGALAIFLASFGILASIVIPVISTTLRALIWLVIYNVPWLASKIDGRTSKGAFGYVRPSELRDLALEEQNEFQWKIFREHRSRSESAQWEQRQAGHLVFGLLLLALVDMLIPYLGLAPGSVLATAENALHSWKIPVNSFLLLGLFFALKWVWFEDSEESLIYYPPLYRKIQRRKPPLYQAAMVDSTSPEFN